MIDHAVDDDGLVAIGAAALCSGGADAGTAAGDQHTGADGKGSVLGRHGNTFGRNAGKGLGCRAGARPPQAGGWRRPHRLCASG
ncbi:hypothetical protein SDC9_175275 [bioreactor metagenome]|uniref:Uncharacterized protein n=1 Tax=bioreactor metagenome TaxID=1076179 RepID=A0A645GLL6_9ZZZZ